MGHAVHHRDSSGEIQFEEVDSLEAALELVERLRNDAGVADVRVFREVPIEVRTYYRVVAVEGETAAEPTATVTSPNPVSSSEPPSGAMPLIPPPSAATAEPASDVEVTATEQTPPEQRRALFSRS